LGVTCIISIIVFCYNTSPLMSSEKDYSDTYLKGNIMNKDRKPEIYAEYTRIQEELWKDYEEIRDESINGYLRIKLQMCYKEFKLLEKSLRDKYYRGKKRIA